MKPSRELTNYVQKFQGGDSKAFEEIYRMSYAYLHTCVMHVIKDEDAAQDMLQETYMEISRNIGQLKDPENFLGWAAVIANRKCYALLKKRNSDIFAHDDEWDDKDLLENIADNEEFIPDSIMEDQEKRRLLREIIDELPDMQRLCVIGFYYNEFSQEEIAKELGIPVNTVKSHLKRAKLKIKDAVIDLDKKKGTRLYSLAPFMLLFFGAEAEACNVPAMSDELAGELGIRSAEESLAGTSGKVGGKFLAGKLWGVAAAVGIAVIGGIIWIASSSKPKDDSIDTQITEMTEARQESEPQDMAESKAESGLQQEAEVGIQEAEEEQQEIGLEEITVPIGSYENYGNAYGGSIPVRKDGLWGAVNYDNEVIVPFEYSGFYAAGDKLGNFVLYNEDSASGNREYFLFDNRGNMLYRGENEVRASGGIYITLALNDEDETAHIEYHSLDGAILVAEECDFIEGRINGFYDGISNFYCSLGTDIYVDMDGADGMGPFEDDVIPHIATIDQQGNLSWREDPYYYIWWNDINASIAKSLEYGSPNTNIETNVISSGYFVGRTLLSTMNHGYYITGSDYIEPGYIQVYDEEGNPVAEINYYTMSVDENGVANISLNTFNEWNGYRGFYMDGITSYNYGSKMVFLVDDKNVLVDFAQNTNGREELDVGEVVMAIYDYIAMADEKYWLVQTGEQWGYIDHDGNEMAMFQGAGAFVNGYALVIEDGEAWMIDEEFRKLESLGKADSVAAMGELYRVTIGDDVHIYHLM